MPLQYGQAKIANTISLGDSHDVSIEWFITHTDYPVYMIERVGERFRIVGANKEEEKKDGGKAEKKARQASKKMDAQIGTERGETGKAGAGKPKSKPGGKRGTKRNKAQK